MTFRLSPLMPFLPSLHLCLLVLFDFVPCKLS
jgi:hypothetical protein